MIIIKHQGKKFPLEEKYPIEFEANNFDKLPGRKYKLVVSYDSDKKMKLALEKLIKK